MKKEYSIPIVEKITIDYKVQTTDSSSCYSSVINKQIPGDPRECAEGTASTFWWAPGSV